MEVLLPVKSTNTPYICFLTVLKLKKGEQLALTGECCGATFVCRQPVVKKIVYLKQEFSFSNQFGNIQFCCLFRHELYCRMPYTVDANWGHCQSE